MSSGVPLSSRLRRRIGLLGGSFNPAHSGHRHISLLALKRFGLDEIWWLVSPQNPLKPVAGMAPFRQRLAQARAVARHPRIKVTDLEDRLGTRYTADTLAKLKTRFPRTRFLWLMGADNLCQIHRWDRWTTIFRLVPIAVLDRPHYFYCALSSRAAQRFRNARLRPVDARQLVEATPPAWALIRAVRHPASATAIRTRRDRARRLAEKSRTVPFGNNRKVTP